MGCRHFAHEQLRVVMLYPIMISPVDAPCLTQPVSLVEIEVPFAPLRRTGASNQMAGLLNFIFTFSICCVKIYLLLLILLGFRDVFVPP